MVPGNLEYLLPKGVRRVPGDLAGIATLIGIADILVLVPVLSDSLLRQVVGTLAVLFVPGYLLLAVVIPEGRGDSTRWRFQDGRGIDLWERIALSVGLSGALIPILGVLIEFTPWKITLVNLLIALTAGTIIGVAAATRRRLATPEPDRFRPPVGRWLESLRFHVLEPPTRVDVVLNVVLAISLVLAVGVFGISVLTPAEETSFTELYLVNDGQDGVSTSGYPTNLTIGEEAAVRVGIGNREHHQVEYTVVVLLQRLDSDPNSTRAVESVELERFSVRVRANETITRPVEFVPTVAGQRLRLAVLLYIDDPPSDVSLDTAYRETHLLFSANRTVG